MSTALEIIPPPPKSPLKRITTLWDLWLMQIDTLGPIARSTRECYVKHGKAFCTFMEGKPLSPQFIIDWVIHLGKKGYSGGYLDKFNVNVKRFLRFLKKLSYTHDDLADLIPGVKKRLLPIPEAFTEEEYNTIKAWCTGREWCQTHLWLMMLSYRTGMSLVDACHLRWCNVHLNENGPSFIDIQRIKMKTRGNAGICQIPIIPFTDVHEWLLNLKKVEHLNYKRHDGITDFVHQDAPGLYLCTFQRINHDFKLILSRAGIPGRRTFRHFRNSFCSNLINSGAQLALVCKMTGHSNVQILLRYLKADRMALEDGLAKSYLYASSRSGVGKGADPLKDNPE